MAVYCWFRNMEMKNLRVFIGLVFILRLDIGIQTQPNVGKHCSSYTFNDAKGNWSLSRALCKKQNGDLVSIETCGEWEYLKDNAQNVSRNDDAQWYIGLKNESNTGWRWLSGNDHIKIGSMNGEWPWQRYEPTGDGKCVVMARSYPDRTYGLFNDLPCSEKQGYICEQPIECRDSLHKYFYHHRTLLPPTTEAPKFEPSTKTVKPVTLESRSTTTAKVSLDNYEEASQPLERSRLPVSCTDPAGQIDPSSAEEEVRTYETVGLGSLTENKQNEPQTTRKLIPVNKANKAERISDIIEEQSPTSWEFKETLETYELIGVTSGEKSIPVYDVVNEHATKEFQRQGLHAPTQPHGKRQKPAVKHDDPLDADGPRETCMTLDKEPSRTDDHVFAVVDKASEGFSANAQPPVKHQSLVLELEPVEHGSLEADEGLVTCMAADVERSTTADDKDDVYAVVDKTRKTARAPERGPSCAGLVYADLDLSQSPGNSAGPVRRNSSGNSAGSVRRNSRTVYSNIDHLQTARKSRLAEKGMDEESENTDA